MKKAAIFRTDGGNNIGMGHVMRCIAVAQELRKREIDCFFALKNWEERIVKTINAYNFIPVKIEEESLQNECENILKIASKSNASMIWTDLSYDGMLSNRSLYAHYLKEMQASGIYVISFDGFTDDCLSKSEKISSDMVIIPYLDAEKGQYLLEEHTKLLAGLPYFVFRGEFRNLAGTRKKIRKKAKNILITMGGADGDNVALKVIKALNALKQKDLNVRCLVGSQSSQLEIKRLKKNNIVIEILNTSNSMANLMIWADVAVIGSGLTKYETGMVGTPSLVVSLNNHHAAISDQFSRKGTILHAGIGSAIFEEDLCRKLRILIEDHVLRKAMSDKGQKMMDGKGIDRILNEIPKNLLV